MSRSAFLIFVAIVSVIYGLGLIIAPVQVDDMHGLASSPETSLMSRFTAAYLLGIAAIAWLARDAADSDGLTAFLRGGLVFTVIGFVVALYGTLTGVMNGLGWIPVVLYVLFAIGFVYYGFMRRRSA